MKKKWLYAGRIGLYLLLIVGGALAGLGFYAKSPGPNYGVLPPMLVAAQDLTVQVLVILGFVGLTGMTLAHKYMTRRLSKHRLTDVAQRNRIELARGMSVDYRFSFAIAAAALVLLGGIGLFTVKAIAADGQMSLVVRNELDGMIRQSITIARATDGTSKMLLRDDAKTDATEMIARFKAFLESHKRYLGDDELHRAWGHIGLLAAFLGDHELVAQVCRDLEKLPARFQFEAPRLRNFQKTLLYERGEIASIELEETGNMRMNLLSRMERHLDAGDCKAAIERGQIFLTTFSDDATQRKDAEIACMFGRAHEMMGRAFMCSGPPDYEKAKSHLNLAKQQVTNGRLIPANETLDRFLFDRLEYQIEADFADMAQETRDAAAESLHLEKAIIILRRLVADDRHQGLRSVLNEKTDRLKALKTKSARAIQQTEEHGQVTEDSAS